MVHSLPQWVKCILDKQMQAIQLSVPNKGSLVAHLTVICSLVSSVIERFTENARFCLICNYLSKIIPALQSRCTRFRFGPLSINQMAPRIDHVIEEER